MTAPVLAGGFQRRTAKKSDDYVAEYVKHSDASGNLPKATTAQKTTRMEKILSDRVNGFHRLGVGMIGPIQLKLRYEGMVRNVLIEDPITPGTEVVYDIIDDLGQAYTLSGHDGEVRVTPFEGKRTRVDFFRIAARPAIRKEDLYQLKVNMVEHAQDESKQAILKAEDSRLMVLLQAALTAYATRPDNPTPGQQTVVIGDNGPISPAALYTAVTMTDLREIESARLLMNVADYRDFYLFPQNETGWAMKDRTVAGQKITTFGEFQIQRSVMVPRGTVYLLPEPEFLGVMPVLYSLDVEENNQVEEFYRGWVMDEFISMAILNPRGIASITKAPNHAALASTYADGATFPMYSPPAAQHYVADVSGAPAVAPTTPIGAPGFQAPPA
jgi:hypothetical protein